MDIIHMSTTAVSAIINILLFMIGLKYFLKGNEQEIKRLSDNASSYIGGYAFAAMIVLLIGLWIKKSGGDNSIFSFQNILFGFLMFIWVILGAIYIWFEAFGNVPKKFKSRHFILYIASLVGLICNSIFTVDPSDIYRRQRHNLVACSWFVYLRLLRVWA